MATRVLRNVDVSKVFAAQIPQQISQVHKDAAKEFTAKRGVQNYSVFAFRRYQKPRKYASIDAIPLTAIPMPSSIGITTLGGRNLAVLVAREFVRMFMQMTPPQPRSGNYRNSLRLTLNGKMRALSTMLKIQETNPLKPGEIVEIWSAVEYASTLEAPNYNADGVFLKITKRLLQRYGQSCAIRFTYRSGQKLGLAFKYMTPVVMIGARGEFPSSIVTRRGYQLRRRKREASRSKLAQMNAKRVSKGLPPLKRLPRQKKGS